jgi:hypothetical protein
MDLKELIRDECEIKDLLTAYEAAYGVGALGNAETIKPRERLLQILEELGNARVVALLLGFAKGFARMSQEICDLCEECGIGIEGQIRFEADHVDLNLSPLDAGWGYGERAA